MMKAHASELTRIGKDKRAVALIQNKMIMLVRAKILRLDANLPGHTEMNSQPTPNIFASPDCFGVVSGEFEEHSFSARSRS